MKTKLFLLLVIFALGLSACLPPVEISPEPTDLPATEPPTEEPQPTLEPTLEPTAEVEIPAPNLYAYVKEFQIYLLNPADLSVMALIAGNLLRVSRWTVTTLLLKFAARTHLLCTICSKTPKLLRLSKHPTRKVSVIPCSAGRKMDAFTTPAWLAAAVLTRS